MNYSYKIKKNSGTKSLYITFDSVEFRCFSFKNDEYDRIMKGKDIQVGFDRKIIVTRKLLDELKTNDIRQRDYLEEAENILIIHGTADEVVPFDSSRAFAENNVIDFIPVEKADHRFQNPAHRSVANKYALEFFEMQ